jgi:hypothetical protein
LYFDKSIQPGQVGTILVKLHTTDKRGPIESSFELETNDPNHRFIKVSVRANVKPLPAYVKRIASANIARGEENGAFQIWPTGRPVITLEPGERLPIAIRIRALAPNAGALKLGAGAPESWKLKGEASEYWLDIQADSASGSRTVPLVVETPDGRSREIRVQLTVNVPAQNLVARPGELDFGDVTLERAEGAYQRLGIRQIVGSFQIKSLSSTLPFLKFEQVVIVPGSNYLIRITIDPSKPLKVGPHQGLIIVETDGGNRIEVPVKLNAVDR